MKKQTKQLVGALTACALMGAMAIGGTIAYLSDTDSDSSYVAIGDVAIEMEQLDGSVFEDYQNLVPNQEVDRKWQINNIGENDTIVFMKVTQGRVTGTIVNDDGTGEREETTGLFWFKQADNPKGGTVEDCFNEDWIELEEQRTEGGNLESVRRVFAYPKVLSAGESAPPLYEKVQLKNFTENVLKDLIPSDHKRLVNDITCAIQASNILEGDADLTELNGDGELSKENLNKIYEIYWNQRLGID